MKRDKLVRFPIDAWEKWFQKKKQIENVIKMETNKNVNVPMTHVFRFYGNRQNFMWNDEVVNYFLNKRRRKMNGKII